MKHAASQLLVGLLGRRHLARLARFLTNAARLDGPNDLASNGEGLVQTIALSHLAGGAAPVVFDVGANVGRWSQALLERSEKIPLPGVSLRVYAFEPCRATYQDLERLASRWPGQLLPVPLAMSSRLGTSTLHIVADGAGTNSFHAHHNSQRATRAEVVAMTTVDAFCQEQGLAHLTLLKIDAEGHDAYVLEGAAELLGRQAIDLVQFEYNHRWVPARRYLRDAFEYLAPLGYHLGKVTLKGIEFYPQWHPELESFREGNYLACLASWRSRFPAIPWRHSD